MSGQPYKYYTDVNKYRNQYLDALNLRASIDDMNLQANKTYKETGTMPAVSQMKDSRTTSEILADTEKLKIDIIDTLSKISNPQFASAVVQYIINSPINQDNRLLIFTAQRINDIMEKLKRIYTYGIKGDQNDVEQIVNFFISMYNDKNAIASSTKDFILKYGSNRLGQFGGGRSDIFTELNNTLQELFSNINMMMVNITSKADVIRPLNNIIANRITQLVEHLIELNNITNAIIQLIPTQTILANIDDILNTVVDAGIDINVDPLGPDIRTLIKYKEYLNSSLPNFSYISLSINKLDTYYKVYNAYLDSIYQIVNNPNPRARVLNEEQNKTFNINTNNFNTAIINLISVLTPNELFDLNTTIGLRQDLTTALGRLNNIQNQPHPQADANVNIRQEIDNVSQRIMRILGNDPTFSGDEIMNYNQILENARNNPSRQTLQDVTDLEYMLLNQRPAIPIPQPVVQPPPAGPPDQLLQDINTVADALWAELINSNQDQESMLLYNDMINDARQNPTREKLRDLERVLTSLRQPHFGFGIRNKGKRGRPKGSGIQKKYSDVVKQSISNDKGIQEDMRFVKFGKYLINNKKLNDGILAVKRPSGNNILEFPSQRISGNMQNVIKTMIGGGIPKYEQLECLSEPEKAYLHKLSSKANIIDKFSIPAPSKTQYEKDIHDFEVMRGELLSGNDNKELIKKFKLHIMKLSKMGSLPKREVSELLEELALLGY